MAAAESLESGTAGASPQTIPLLNAYGRLENVPLSGLAAAKAKGYRPETDEEFRKRYNTENYGGVKGAVLEGLAGAGTSATLGLSDLALTKLGLVEPLTLQRLRDENPVAATVGEVAGIGLPLLLGGAGGVVGAGAKAVGFGGKVVSSAGHLAERGVSRLLSGLGEKGLAGVGRELAGRMAGGALEGAVYGAGHAVHEAAIADHELTAEHLLAGAKTGALLGGATSGAFMLAGAGIAATRRSIETKLQGTIGQKLEDLVNDFAEGSRIRTAFGINKKAMKRILDEEKPYFREQVSKELTDILNERGLRPTSLEDVADAIQSRRAAVSAEREGILRKLDEVAEGTPAVRVEDIANKIETDAVAQLDPVADESAINHLRSYAQKIRDKYPERISFDEAAQVRLAAQAKGNFDAAVPAPIRAAWNDISRAWNDVIDTEAAPLLKEAGLAEDAYLKLRHREAGLIKMDELAKDRVAANLGVRRFGLTDTMTGLSIGGGLLAGGHLVGGPLGGLAGAAANKLGRTYGPAAIATLATKGAQVFHVVRAAAKVDKAIGDDIVRFVEEAHSAEQTLTRAGRASAEEAVNIELRKAVSGHGEKPGKHGESPTRVRDIFHALPDAAFDGAKGHPDDDDDQAAFRRFSANLTALASNPAALAARTGDVTQAMSQHLPQTSAHVAAKLMKTVEFLHEKLPKPAEAANPLVPTNWQPAPSEIARYARYVRAAHEPMSVISDFRRGQLSSEGVETLRALYPRIYQSVAAKLAAKLSEAPRPLPYQYRLQCSQFLGWPVTPSLRADRVRYLQQQWATPQPKQASRGGGVRVTGIANLRTAEMTEPNSVRIARGHT